jgi:PQQ-like domain
LVAAPGALIELDADFKERWRTRLSGAAWGCQGLPNGHRLVAVNSHSMVVEYDDAGREVWKKDRLPAPPTSVERLDSGNTLIACAAARQIVEVAPDGSITAIFASGQPILAQRLDNGNTLAVLQQPDSRVVELTAAGQVIWDARTSGLVPTHAVRLPGGNTLVTLTQARKVVEYDAAGKTIVWESTPAALIAPSAAQRLTNGNTLVADLTGLREIDPSGKQVRWYRQQQVTGLSVY